MAAALYGVLSQRHNQIILYALADLSQGLEVLHAGE
jgi:hypothetical protein